MTGVQTCALPIFDQYRDSIVKLLRKVYKGNASKKAKKFNDEIDSGGAVVHQRLPNGSRDSRNHNSMFKPKIASAITILKEYRLEVESKSLPKLRWTKKKWLTALWSFITLIVLTIAKEMPDIIKAFRSK